MSLTEDGLDSLALDIDFLPDFFGPAFVFGFRVDRFPWGYRIRHVVSGESRCSDLTVPLSIKC